MIRGSVLVLLSTVLMLVMTVFVSLEILLDNNIFSRALDLLLISMSSSFSDSLRVKSIISEGGFPV